MEFYEKCLGENSCEIDLDFILLKDGKDNRNVFCTQEPGTELINFGYEVSVSCIPYQGISIDVPKFGQVNVSRDTMAALCVSSDLLIIIVLYFSLLLVRAF